jgi:uncharacterized protein YbjT (DUF2867 family)
MIDSKGTVLVVGATGSIGRLAVEEAVRAGFTTRSLVRTPDRTTSFPGGTEVVVGDPTRADTFAPAVDGVTGVIFTHGSHGSPREAELVDYGAVRNVLESLTGPGSPS